ncbi:unnamed protein product [Ambrosiozyma monospora]|uniref:Unnamed protein product n=1 Tax=Ambrosiozyma monospora TaxID=43982 RepID=A0ACB5SVV6_AMBMO|nr:unnamed protein product [Ambrosiozyma monospora]
MQYKYSVLGALGLASQACAAYIPSEPWSTLTPDATIAGAYTDYTSTFGIQINPIATSSSSAKAKRDVVTQIGDGQIQATTETKSSTKATSTAAAVVTQIGDGQIQATTETTSSKATSTAAAVVTQIGDGQIQATTETKSSTKATSTAAAVVTQIGDGQIQATTETSSSKATSTAAAVVTQIGDGQIQATTETSSTADAVVTQIGDGQIQASTSTSKGASKTASATASAAKSSSSSSSSSSPDIDSVACYSEDALSMQLNGGILTDGKGRIGSIVANRQFQFDGPPPQAGAIYAAGWSITEDGLLAIGNTTTFYQCLSGNFYNLYDETLGEHCQPVHLDVVDLVSC